MRIELSHDILAKKVFEKASNEDKQILQIERLISDSYQRYISRELFMERADIEYVEPFLGKVNKTEVERKFIADSKNYIIEQDRKRKKRVFITNAIMFGLIVLAIGTWVLASNRTNDIRQELEILEEDLKNAKVRLRSAEKEANEITKNANAIADSAKNKLTIANYQVVLANQNAEKIRQRAEWATLKSQKESEAKIEKAQRELKLKIEKAQRIADQKIEKATKKANDKIQDANKRAEEIGIEADKIRAEKKQLKNISETSQLSSQALRSLNSGNKNKAAKLALDARKKWIEATKDKNNELQNAENYMALNEILKAFEGQTKRVYDLHGTSIRSVATNDKGWLVSADEDGVIHISKQNNKDLAKIKDAFKVVSISSNFKNQDQIHTVGIAENNIVAGTLLGNILIFNADTLINSLNRANKSSTFFNLSRKKVDSRVKVFKKFGHPIQYLEVSPNSKYIAFNTLINDQLYILNANTGSIIKNTLIKGINILTWENDKALWVGKEKGVDIFNFDGKKLIKKNSSNLPSGNIKAITVTKKHVLFGSNEGNVWILDRIKKTYLKDLNQSGFFKAHRSGITSLKFSPNESKFVSSSMDGTAKIWNIKHLSDPENEKIVLNGHQKWIYGATFSSDGQFIYTVSEDATLQQWYVDESKLAKRLESEMMKKK